LVSKKKREYRKRKHKTSTSQPPNQNSNAHQPVYSNNDLGMLQSDLYSSDEDVLSPVMYTPPYSFCHLGYLIFV